ncbi:MAG: DUF2723 domain-containing protein [Mesotoga sp.]|nr:DUF2723 domain-containing protein [Mesotoga sp.]
MKNWLKSYWPEILVFAGIAAMLLNNTAPDMTWINTDSDGVHYVYAAKYFYVAHKSGAPLFLLLGHLFLQIPFGTEFWRMALMSSLATSVSCVLVYKIVRHYINNRWLGILGAVMFGGSALIISQSTIVETYALLTMLSVIGYYFTVKKHFTSAALAFGFGVAIHPIIGFTALPLIIFHKELRRPKQIIIMASFLVFYLYNPLVAPFNPPPTDMWGNLKPNDEWHDFLSTAVMLGGGLAIYDFPKRILDTIGIMAVSLGVGLVCNVIYFSQQGKAVFKNELFWVTVIPLAFFMINLAPQTYVYAMPTIAFGTVAAMVYLSQAKRVLLYATVVVTSVLFAINAWNMDIGRTLDPKLEASRFYHQELSKVPDGQIIMPYNGWEWAMVYAYNKNENRNIISVSVDTVASPVYRKVLDGLNVKYRDVGIATQQTVLEKQNELAQSIVEMNDNVWVTVPYNSENYGAKVVPANHDASLVMKIMTEPPGKVHWKPSNPYGFITGQIEVSEWTFITLSNHNMLFFAAVVVVWFILDWILHGMPRKKHKAIV